MVGLGAVDGIDGEVEFGTADFWAALCDGENTGPEVDDANGVCVVKGHGLHLDGVGMPG